MSGLEEEALNIYCNDCSNPRSKGRVSRAFVFLEGPDSSCWMVLFCFV